jgi:hypothetical protein
MLRIWKEFSSNSHHGLDVYLSTRIRHGTLTGHLRRPFEEQSLICQRDAVSGQYRDHPFWSERLREQEPNEISGLQNLLKEFSAEIDGDIIRLNTENLRVRLAAADMLNLALHIVETKKGKFDPSKFEDQYEDALKELIERSARAKRLKYPAPPRNPTWSI